MRTFFFLIFEKMQAILLYWFALQQQCSTSRCQIFDFLAKMAQTKTVRKTTYMWHSGPNNLAWTIKISDAL